MLLFCFIVSHFLSISHAFWFYGYDRVYRDPYSETSNNEIVSTSVITYLASSRNTEIVGISTDYKYKLILFESVVQYQNSNENYKWNLGVWDSFIYCDETMTTLCLYFSDGEYCDNDAFRQTSIQLTCHYDDDVPTLYSINEYEECIYSAKLYFPQLCSAAGIDTVFVRDPNEIDKIKASSYISSKSNKINTLPYTLLSGTHNIGLSMYVSEIKDVISITLQGPADKYFAVGFGSNGMLNTFAIVVNGETETDNVFFEQLLDSHASGYTLSPSFVLEQHTLNEEDNTQQITIARRLSSAVEIDKYWIFSCVDDYIDIIWSVGEAKTFEKHIAFGQERLTYDVNEIESYDKSQIINGWDGMDDAFNLKINWLSIFVLVIAAIIAFYVVRKYKQNILDFVSSFVGAQNNRNGALYPASGVQQYGSAQDSQPLMENKL